MGLKLAGTPRTKATRCCCRRKTRYLKLRQRHLGHAELTAALSEFTFPAQVVGDLLPHHSLFTFTQRTRNLKEGAHIQVVLEGSRQVRSPALEGTTVQENLLTGIC